MATSKSMAVHITKLFKPTKIQAQLKSRTDSLHCFLGGHLRGLYAINVYFGQNLVK